MEQHRIQIRCGTAMDNQLLAEIGARAFADTFGPDNTAENMAVYLAESFSPEKQAAELAAPGTVFLIAEVDGKAAGYCRLREGPPEGIPTGASPIEIVRIYALKEWIGRGVGPALMQASLDEAEKRGCDTIWLDVWEENPRGIGFYRKWGFEKVGTQTFKLGDDLQRDLIMQRPLELPRA
jgi:diamine N-acetyltransferase